MTNLLHNDTVARALAQAIADGNASLGTVPGLLRRVIKEKMWQRRVLPETGEEVTFERFEQFITEPPLKGLGTTMGVIKALCKAERDVIELMEREIQQPMTLSEAGALGGRGNKARDISRALNGARGTSRDYTIARLKRDAPDIAERVISGEISAAEGRRQASEGGEYKRRSISINDPQSAAESLFNLMDHALLREVIALVTEMLVEESLNEGESINHEPSYQL